MLMINRINNCCCSSSRSSLINSLIKNQNHQKSSTTTFTIGFDKKINDVNIENNNKPKLPELTTTDFEPNFYKTKLSIFEIEKIHRINLNPCLKTIYQKPLLITQGYMQYVWDDSKKRYLDMFGGIVTTSVGHCHPRLVQTIEKQSNKLWHTSSLYLTEEMHDFANRLANHFPEPLRCLFLCNSGSEANDIAITMCRLYTQAFDILALRNAYHGSTLSTMPLCGIGNWKFPLPTSFGFHHVTNPDPFNGRMGGNNCRDSIVQTNRNCDCNCSNNNNVFASENNNNNDDASEQQSNHCCKAEDYYIEELQLVLDSILPKKIAGFFAESIQGVGGVVQYPRNYIRRAYDLIKQRNGLMVMDEVQSGFGRTGTHFWEFQSHGIVPDIVTMAKGIGNGFPMAAVITTTEIAQTLTQASYFNTFGGNPMASAIGSTVLDIIDEENLQKRSNDLGTNLLKRLAKLRDQYGDIVGDVRGKGLMIGIEMIDQTNNNNGVRAMSKEHFDRIIEDCKDMGLILGRGGPKGNVFRLSPPMCINEDDVEFTVEVLKKSFDNYHDWLAKNK